MSKFQSFLISLLISLFATTIVFAWNSPTTGPPNSAGEAMYINLSGNVGIATTTPAYPLTVAGTIYSSTGGFRFPDGTSQTTAGTNYWTLSGSNLYANSTSYNVGIGTTGPITQLHVPGRIPSSAVGSIATGFYPRLVYVQGRYVYVVNGGSNTLQIFDISNPAGPVSVGSVGTGLNPASVYIQGRYAYIANIVSNTLQIFDISNPASPVNVGSISTGLNPVSVYVQGRYVYVVNTGVNTIQIFDISNPASPVSVGSISTNSNPRFVYVQGRYAYVANYGANTVQIFDISNPASPVSVGSISTGLNPISIYVQGRYAYVANYGVNTIQIFDISNPASPVNVGSISTGLNPISIYVQGRYAYVVNYGANTVQIFDVSNPASPVSVGSVGTGAGPRSVYVQGRYAYVANYLASTLQIFDVGGAYVQQLETGGIETGTLSTRNNLQVGNDLDVRGGLNVGRGIYTTGPFSIYGGASGSTFVIDQNGNVGIGTASLDPNYKITTSGGGIKAESTTQPAGYFSSTGGGPAIQTGTGNVQVNGRILVSNVGATGGTGLFFLYNPAGEGEGNILAYDYDVANNYKSLLLAGSAIRFQTGTAVERMRITSDGKVGIATTTPSAELDVNGTAKAKYFLIKGSYLDTLGLWPAGVNYINLRTSANGSYIGGFGQSGNPPPIGAYLSQGGYFNGTDWYGSQDIATTFRASNYGFQFFSNTSLPPNSIYTPTEVMRITTSGNVGIGTTGPTSKLQVVGLPVYADNAAATAGGLTVGAFYRTSTGVLMVVY